MAYENFMSKMEDVIWLAYKLKFQLGSKISINQIGLYKEILEGKYHLKGCNRGIDFTILYSGKEFLRISVGEVNVSARYDDKLFALNELKNAISSITRNGVSLGEPSVFYNVSDEKCKIPSLEYIYADKENAIKEFQDKTIFDDGCIPEDVIIFDSIKEKEEFGIVEDYDYVTTDGQDNYNISIAARLKNKTDIEIDELRNVIYENLDELFNGDDSLLTYYNDISYVVSYIKNALSLAEEQMLDITIVNDKKEIKSIKYIDGTLVYYGSRCKFGECIMSTNYSKKEGIKFETKCDTNAYDLIEDVVRNELQNINALKDIHDQYNVKSNNNLLKLVRRIGNK